MRPRLDEQRDDSGLVNTAAGLVDRRIFSDQELYEAELENIFARAWNFMCHESQITKPGDFFTSWIGEDKVICVRDKEGGIQVLLNSCRHRGNAVCRADEGHASAFMCAYHGWTYDLKGDLVGVPGFKDIYRGNLDKAEWGLAKAAKVESYRGFVFATMDPDAPSLYDYLGEVGRYSIDTLADQGEIRVVPGIQKSIMPCNWKFAAENVVDSYHRDITHMSFDLAVGTKSNRGGAMSTYWSVMLGEYGHIELEAMLDEDVARLATPGVHYESELWRKRHDAMPKDAKWQGRTTNGNIFPNIWIQSRRLCIRLPRGPLRTEIWWFTLLDPTQDEVEYKRTLDAVIHGQGPAGMVEQDDGDNWALSTVGARSRGLKNKPLNYSANLGRGQVIPTAEDQTGPSRISAGPSEHAQLWFYKSWSEWMAARDWPELRALHSLAPEGMV